MTAVSIFSQNDDDDLDANSDYEDWGSDEEDTASIDDNIPDREIETASSTAVPGSVSVMARKGSS